MANQVSPEEVRLPKSTYKLRCVTCEKVKSKKDDDMLKVEFEIIEHAPLDMVDDNGEEYKLDINGLSIMDYRVMTAKTISFFNKWVKGFGFPPFDSVDDMLGVDPTRFVGRVIFARCESEAQQPFDEIKQAPMVDPYTGKPVFMYSRRIKDIFEAPQATE